MDTMTEIFIGSDAYIHSDSEDGLYESDIECAECGQHIGTHQHDTLDSTVETFTPYWMLDEDNNYNLCEGCYEIKDK